MCPPEMAGRHSNGMSLQLKLAFQNWGREKKKPGSSDLFRIKDEDARVTFFPLLPVRQEVPRRGEEVPQGVRHGEPRHVVHGLPLEESLPEVCGLRAGA